MSARQVPAFLWFLLPTLGLILLWSGIGPKDRATWWMEVAPVLVCCVCLAISALYELIEWWAALLTSPETGTAFLGTQGDVWDTQWDMALALAGSVVAQLALSRLHQRQLDQLSHPPV
jgi:uncharacterized membrane protein YjdF